MKASNTYLFFFGAVACACVVGTLAQDSAKTTPAPPTPPPTTTTSQPTPTTTPPSTTTTTTTPPPAPTKPTTPAPPPAKYPANEGRWALDKNNTTCIMLKGAFQISILYVDEDKKKNATATVDIPVAANVTGGNCSEGWIVLSWPSSAGRKLSTLNFTFERNDTGHFSSLAEKGKFALVLIDGSVVFDNDAHFGDTLVNVTIAKAAFQTPMNHSYSCMVQETLTEGKVTLKSSDMRIQAFMNKPSGHNEFDAAIDCVADDASDVVPLAVGAALAGLIVIVLFAYLIGRRRSRSRGYQSV